MSEVGTGTLIAGRYRLEHQVGQGGMGSVWVAEDDKLRRWVAVKLLGAQCASSRNARERFEREATALAQLRSPHVVQVFDYGVAEVGGPFMVMELLNGQDLYAWIRRNRRAPLALVSKVIVQAARGLSAIHRAGIVHRDLKPSNLFVVNDHDENIIKIFDFGLAKGLSDITPLRDQTGEGVLLGTPRYMSPEQAHGAKCVDHRSDLWSLAVIAYLAITGRLPFRGTGVGEVITKIHTEKHIAPSKVIPGLSSAVDAFFDKALAKKPEDRLQDAQQFGRDFELLPTKGASAAAVTPLHEADTMFDEGENDTYVGPEDDQTDPHLTVLDTPSELPHDAPDSTIVDDIDSLELAPTRFRPRSRRRLVSMRQLWVLSGATALLLVAVAVGLGMSAGGSMGPTVATAAVPSLGLLAPTAPSASAPRTPAPSSLPSAVAAAPSSSNSAPTNQSTTSGLLDTASTDSESSSRGLELFPDRH